MPWEKRTVYEQREEFVRAASHPDCNFSALCREYGITRRTGYKWVERYENSQPLDDRSRRPQTSPGRISAEMEQRILSIRVANPGWGARKIHDFMESRGVENVPCVKTVNNVLSRNGCISPEESLKHKPFIRFEKEACNNMWQTDFKGEVAMENKRNCHTLTILDDHARFLLEAAPDETRADVVIPVFQSVFRIYGLPDSILSDNGAQFAGFKKGISKFERFLMDLDILPLHGRFYHPQTQGKIERLHRTMKQELLKHRTFTDIADARRQLDWWRYRYNNERPHEALGGRCPGEVYRASSRQMPEQIRPYEYSGEFRVVKANGLGYVRFAHWQVYFSETMANQYLEFRPKRDGHTFVVCYRNFQVGEFDAHSGQLLNRDIFRL